MAEFLKDPNTLTKERLKSELRANDVPLPSGEHKKDVYVQLYLKHLTRLNEKTDALPDTFSSDEDIIPVVSNRSRSGKVTRSSTKFMWYWLNIFSWKLKSILIYIFVQKAIKKTDKNRKEEVDIESLTDSDLMAELKKYGINSGPIVGEFPIFRWKL